MPGIPSSFLGRLRQTLLNCGPFDTQEQLRAAFLDERIYQWKDQLPEAGNRFERVIKALAFLADRHNGENENGLVLALRVLSELHDENDSCHPELSALATELEQIAANAKISTRRDSEESSRSPSLAINYLAGALGQQGWKRLREDTYQGVKFDLVGERRTLGAEWYLLVRYLPTTDVEAVLDWREITGKLAEEQASFNRKRGIIPYNRAKLFMLILLTDYIPLGTEIVLQKLITDDLPGVDHLWGGGQWIAVADLSNETIYGAVPKVPVAAHLVGRKTHAAIQALFSQ